MRKLYGYWAMFAIFILLVNLYVRFTLPFDTSKNKRLSRRKAGRLFLKMTGIKAEVYGNFQDCEMVFMNHQSMLDIIVMEVMHPSDVCWMAKKELFSLPFFGTIMKKANHIPVDRENRHNLKVLLHAVENRIKEDDRVVCIFPEGTRAKSLELLEFKKGVTFFAKKLDLLVQPVVLTGFRHAFDSKAITSTPSTVKLYPIETIKSSHDTQWLEKTREAMQKKLNEDGKR